ncbi:TonB-dependent receptor [Salegentibacter salinarum]|uniref:TonB-dependent receptor n=1 Tax=Salegentibacter salinarum TaxID=447422 RepID=A0A2N0U3M6_9FLAO|nr:carboxypeptidase-like regulatory domain-containing protein [Salegentibacter salinarum]PKD21478.1 TonB-dependent receptor [Salegentibacter salinarum]SKB37926.1 TonB-dependent Receptor Plug Domain [Salegentibacter salinarum]
MRIFLIFLFFLCNVLKLSAQENPRIDLSFEDATVEEVMMMIEDRTAYKFFYSEEWIDDSLISGSYNNEDIETVLTEIFNATNLNFFILNDQIIITRNNVIYDELPTSFYPERSADTLANDKPVAVSEDSEERNHQPVFYRESGTVAAEEIETIYIGKEDKSNPKNRFILSGIVTNAETGLPISNLSVVTASGNQGSVTNEEGYYELELPAGASIIETISLGNLDVKKRIVIYNDGQLNLSLDESFEQLGEVLVDSEADRNVRSVIAGVESIDVSQIKNIPLVLGERDILKVATTLPGITTAGEGAAGYNVRGGKTDQNLILLDDAVIYNPAHFFGIFSGINPFTTGEVDIYKGNIPAEYGGRLSSVFDIKSKDANTEKFVGEVSVGPVTSNVALEIPIVKDKSGLMLGGRSTYSDWILRNLDEESLSNSSASFYDLIAKYNHKFSEKTSLRTTGYYSRDVFSITSDSLFRYSNLVFSANLNHKFNERNEMEVVVSNSGYQFDIDYESEFNNNFTSGYNINETEAKIKMNYRHSSAHNFEYGLSSKLYLVDPGEISPLGSESIVEPFQIDREQGLESAIFISDNFKVNDELLISAGLRYSLYAAMGPKSQNTYEEGLPRNESTLTGSREVGNGEVIETYARPEFRLSARYAFLPDFSTKISYNNTYQYIHTLSNNTTISPTDTYKLTDLNIKPQQAKQYSLGLYKNFKENMYEFSVEGYYKESDNILDYKVGAQLFLNENVETEVLQGDGKAYGVEFLLKKSEGRLNGWLGYTYSRSLLRLDGEFREQRVNNGDFFPANFDKPHDVSLVANYKLTKRFSFSANFVYQTGRPVTIPVGKFNPGTGQLPVYSDRNQFRIPDYYRLDLSFNVEGNHKIEKFAHSFWNISVYNVLGRNNPYSVFFVTDDGDIQAYQSSIFSIPIPTITYNFRF